MHRVGKLDVLTVEGKCRGDSRFVFHCDVLQPEQLRQCVMNGDVIQSVEATKNPSGLDQNCLADPDGLSREQRLGSRRLHRVITVNNRTVTLVSTAIMAPLHFPPDGSIHLRRATLLTL